jgi:hypothetical protein
MMRARDVHMCNQSLRLRCTTKAHNSAQLSLFTLPIAAHRSCRSFVRVLGWHSSTVGKGVKNRNGLNKDVDSNLVVAWEWTMYNWLLSILDHGDAMHYKQSSSCSCLPRAPSPVSVLDGGVADSSINSNVVRVRSQSLSTQS